MKETVNRKSTTIWLCGMIFGLSLFVAITPVVRIDGHSEYRFPPKVIVALIIGWDLIIAACIFLIKSKRKRRLN
jgi:hypothetical protein